MTSVAQASRRLVEYAQRRARDRASPPSMLKNVERWLKKHTDLPGAGRLMLTNGGWSALKDARLVATPGRGEIKFDLVEPVEFEISASHQGPFEVVFLMESAQGSLPLARMSMTSFPFVLLPGDKVKLEPQRPVGESPEFYF